MNLLRQILRKPFWVIFAAAVIWYAGTMTVSCFLPDWQYIEAWAVHIHTAGLGQVYQGSPLYNYPPLMAYGLWLFGLPFTDLGEMKDALYLFKFLPLAFDLAAAIVAVKWAGDRRREALCLLVLVANPIYVFESFTWGQIDSTYCALVFFSLYAAVRDRPVWSALLFTLAFNFKIQALLFAPLFGLVWLWKFRQPWAPKRVALAWGLCGIVQLAILIPFIAAGQLGRMLGILASPVNYYHSISMNAFNFWHFFYGERSYVMDDTAVRVVGGLTAQQAGLALFFGISLLILLPPFLGIVKAKIKNSPHLWSEESLLLMFSLIPLVFFFFCTQMHERYAQPAILFVAVYSFRTRRYGLLVLMFAAYGINMDYVFQGMITESWQRVLFNTRLVAGLYAALLAALGWYYFRSLAKPTAAATTALTAPADPRPAGAP